MGGRKQHDKTMVSGGQPRPPKNIAQNCAVDQQRDKLISSYLFQIIGNFGIQFIGRGRVDSFRIFHGLSLDRFLEQGNMSR